jgi:hypothetical protein
MAQLLCLVVYIYIIFNWQYSNKIQLNNNDMLLYLIYNLLLSQYFNCENLNYY